MHTFSSKIVFVTIVTIHHLSMNTKILRCFKKKTSERFGPLALHWTKDSKVVDFIGKKMHSAKERRTVGISGACASMRNGPILGFQVHSLFLLFCVFLGAVNPFLLFWWRSRPLVFPMHRWFCSSPQTMPLSLLLIPPPPVHPTTRWRFRIRWPQEPALPPRPSPRGWGMWAPRKP